MTERERQYKKNRQKRIVVNLTLSDSNRWSCYASFKQMPVAKMVRQAVEREILETEDSFDQSIEDIVKHQEELKKVCYD